MDGLIGRKVGMTQVFDDNGQSVPVTVVEAGPCTVVQVRSRDRDGYDAVQLGFGSRREKRAGKALTGHMKKAGGVFESLVEFRLEEAGEYAVGQQIKLDEVFSAGDMIDVSGSSKGRGFAGVMKRHGFAGQSATHGTHESFRGGGAIGACAYPGRVFKGKRMPGRLGGKTATVQNLEVVGVRPDDNVLLVRGGLPGGKNGQLVLKRAVKGEADA